MAGGGREHALRSDGSIVAGGDGTNSQVSNLPIGPRFRQVTGGREYALVLTGTPPALPTLPACEARCTAGTSAHGCRALLSASGFTVTATGVEGGRPRRLMDLGA